MPTSIDLLPQSPNGLLLSPSDCLRVLTLKKALIGVAISALENFFIHHRAHEFDGHVGETLCQIRAYHLYSLKTLCDQHNSFSAIKKLGTFHQLSYKITEAIRYYQSNTTRKIKYQTVAHFLQEHNIICDLLEIEIYLIQLHLLSHFKFFDANRNAAIDYKKMCRELNISKHTARRIVHLYQIYTSQYSVNFINSLLVNMSGDSDFCDLFNFFGKTDEDGRSTLPCYWVMDVLYKNMLEQKCPILVLCERKFEQQFLDRIFLAFKPANTSQKEYEYCELNRLDANELCFVLEGTADYNSFSLVPSKAEYIKFFINYGIKNILFSNMAIHPQYAGKKLSLYKDVPYLKILEEIVNHSHQVKSRITTLEKLHLSQQEMKNYAVEIVCGQLNPSLFYIRHILCDTLENQAWLNNTYTHVIFSNLPTSFEATSYWKGSLLPIREHYPDFLG